MEMTNLFIESHDLDWFAVNAANFVAHFTSGGTDKIPEELRQLRELWELHYDVISGIPATSGYVICEKNVPLFDDSASRNQYLESFIHYARKGIFSFDINFDDLTYTLIAAPETPLTCHSITLPTGKDLVKIHSPFNCTTAIRI